MKLRDGKGTLFAGGSSVAQVEIAASGRTRTRGLLGRDGIDGAILLYPANAIHTFFMKFPLDVAFVDKNMKVLSTIQMKRHRISWFRFRARHVLEAEWGRFEEWGIRRGTQLEIEVE